MSNNDYLDIESLGKAEKLKKFGDPRRSFILTAVFLVIVACFSVWCFAKSRHNGVTSDYLSYYPSSTVFYIDSELDSKKLNRLNNLTSLKINSLSDLINRAFVNCYSGGVQPKLNDLINQAFSNNFSFGSWEDNDGNIPKQRSMAIFSIKRENKIQPLLQEIGTDNLSVKTYNGYNITTSNDKEWAFTTARGKVFFTDSRSTMEYIIDHNLVKNKDSLLNKKDVKTVLKNLEKDRLATILLPNPDYELSKIQNFSKNKVTLPGFDFDKFANSFGTTAISVNTAKDSICLNSYTPYDFSLFSDKTMNKTFKSILNSDLTGFKPDSLPKNTVFFVAINDFKNYINLGLEMYGVKNTPEYEQAKQFVKLITSLDVDNDIIGAFSGNMTVAFVDAGNSIIEPVILFSQKNNASSIISKIIGIAQYQLPSSKISKVLYKKHELQSIVTSSFPQKLMYGAIKADQFALGSENAMESLINAGLNKKSALIESIAYKSLSQKEINNAKILTYLDVDNMAKFVEAQKLNSELSSSNQIYFDKLKNKVKIVLFTVDSKNNLLKTTLQFKLKK